MVPVANLVSTHGAPANIPFPFPSRSSPPATLNHSSLPLPPTSPYPLLRHSPPRGLISSFSLPATAAISLPAPASPMAANDAGSPERVRSPTPYEEVLNCLSSLITRKERGDGTNRGCQFDLMFVYVKMLDLEEDISKLKVIHVAGTKGKGSTCSFTESILRSCGIRTGLFTSPHLIDIRERFKLDGMEISEEKFMSYFWWCWDKLQEKTNDTVPMPTFFRFLALLALKIFSAEQVDVAILEVGLGGRFDATNVVKAPVVCGVSSLGYDHMEILGNTLELIASEKAGIFKEGVPAYTVPQPEEAMSSLENKASQLDVPLTVASPLDAGSLRGRKLGLDGEHQYLNAGLAVALCRAWLKETGHSEGMYLDDTSFLPEQFIHGLTTTSLSGRAQIVPDLQFRMQSPGILTPGGLIFYLDGAHSPESLEMCARWFSREVKEDNMHEDYSEEQIHNYHNAKQILLFNCMSVRDPHLLLPRLVNACADQGVRFHKAVFVPNQSLYHKVDSHAVPTIDPKVDLSWQQKLQRVWDNLANGDKSSRVNGYSDNKTMGSSHEERTDINLSVRYLESSTIFSSLPLAIKWLRDTAQENQSVRFQVLVTGSLHLVGDVLRLIKK